MTPAQVALVRDSFEQLARNAGETGELFYKRLFILKPQLRHLFNNDIQEQSSKLMEMFGVVVKGLGSPSTLVPALRESGERHKKYGVEKQDYAVVAEALLWTIQEVMGPALNSELHDSWASAFGLIASAMQGKAVTA
jgi:hemoglobin-like flavoprotein